MSNSDQNRGAPWEDVIVAERMETDREFHDRIRASNFSNQAWGLVMMATEFEVVDPEAPDEAYLSVNIDQLDSVLPAMKEVDEATGYQEPSSSSSVVDSLRNLLGGGGPSDDERRTEAEELATEYAELLQRRLVANGKWEQVCEIASESG